MQKLILKTQNGLGVYDLASLCVIEADNNYSVFKFDSGKEILVCKTLKSFEFLSEFGFERWHRSAMINLSRIEQVNTFTVKVGQYTISHSLTQHEIIDILKSKKFISCV